MEAWTATASATAAAAAGSGTGACTPAGSHAHVRGTFAHTYPLIDVRACRHTQAHTVSGYRQTRNCCSSGRRRLGTVRYVLSCLVQG